MEKKYLDKDGLTTYNNEISKKLTTLEKSDITSFTTSKPDENNVITINATTKNNQNIQALTLYDSLDGRYPYSALTAKQGQVINSRLNDLEESILNTTSVKKYFISTAANSEEDKATYKEIIKDFGKVTQLVYYNCDQSVPILCDIQYTEGALVLICTSPSVPDEQSRYIEQQHHIIVYFEDTEEVVFVTNVSSNPTVSTADLLVLKSENEAWTPENDYDAANKKYVDDKFNNTISSNNVKKIEVVTEYPAVLDEDTLYLLVSD